jgi:ribosomal protein L6P/L9E
MSFINKHNLIKTKNNNQERFTLNKTEFSNIYFYKYRNKYILGNLNNEYYYLKLPNITIFEANKDFITFVSKKDKNKSAFTKFVENLKEFLLGFKILYTKRIKIRGLGYKVSKEDNFLVFRLGYSKQILVSIPNQLKDFVIKKNLLIVKSLDKNFLGNFVHFLIGLKKRDIYKGKGLSLEYKIRKLKPVKKK